MQRFVQDVGRVLDGLPDAADDLAAAFARGGVDGLRGVWMAKCEAAGAEIAAALSINLGPERAGST